jgi:mono/diheme cytochrome c family protein
MSAERLSRFSLLAAAALFVTGCSWFTDFKQQPKIDPWESAADSIPPRGNPQYSIPTTGTAAPALLVSHAQFPATIDSMSSIANPVAADQRSLENGRKSYQINCAICHGPGGMGNGNATKYGMPGMALINDRVKGLSDGYIFGMIRNGRGLMPSYNRIDELERWDIVNYIRGLEGRYPVVAATVAPPGVTGDALPSATELGPTRPAPYYLPNASQATVRLGPGAHGATAAPAPATTAADSSRGAAGVAPAAARTDSTKGGQP